MQADALKSAAHQDLKDIERRDWQLLVLTIGLLMVLGGLTVATYFIIWETTFSDSGGMRSIAFRALGGLSILITLFSAYVIHSRMTLHRVKSLLENQAIRDPLTGLYNRFFFGERIKDEMKRADRYQYSLAILFCDLDHFKIINDKLGHQVGDEVLKATAKCIEESIRASDLAFRWGGDELIVILNKTTRDGALVAAERIRKRVCAIGRELQQDLDISIGLSLYPDHGNDIEQLIQLADLALYRAKQSGDKIHLGEEDYWVDEHSIKIVFQPVVNVHSDHILGYEALTRDAKDQLNVFELFKRYQAVGKLQALKLLCFKTQMKIVREEGLQRAFLNVDFDMLSRLEPISKPPGVDIILEISESDALHDVDTHLEILRNWRKKGFKLALDDFGAGFVSFPFLAQLVPDYIKLDRSAILQATASREFKSFLKSLVLALKGFSKEGIIAEGIETAQELMLVKELGIDLAQGFLLGKPQQIDKPNLAPSELDSLPSP